MGRPIKNGEMRIRDMILFVERLKSAPCMDCGVTYPSYVMDYDHARGVKVMSIAKIVRSGADMEEVAAELEKCDLVCANCHRERTHRRAVQRQAARGHIS